MMSLLSKFFSLVILSGVSFISINALGMTTTNTDELYAESLKLERSSAEIPTSIDTNNTANNIQDDYVVESMSDLEEAAPPRQAIKKVSSVKSKKNAKN